MKLTPIIQRLESQAPLLLAVDGAAEFAAVEQFTRLPAAYVVPIDDTAGQNKHMQAVSQKGVFMFGVMLVIKNARDATGEAAADELQAVRDEVQQGLVGWIHPDADGVTVWGGGSMQGFDDGLLMWFERFSAPHWVRRV